jgi:hypothetical protein
MKRYSFPTFNGSHMRGKEFENEQGEWVKYYETALHLEVLCKVAIDYVGSEGIKKTLKEQLDEILGEGN